MLRTSLNCQQSILLSYFNTNLSQTSFVSYVNHCMKWKNKFKIGVVQEGNGD